MVITARQTDILDAIVSHFETYGFSPTTRELAKACNLASTNTVHQHLYALCSNGYIAIQPGGQRNIRILRRSNGQRVRPALVEVTT